MSACVNNQETDLDPDAIARHLDLLFGYLDGFVPLRLLSEIGTPSQPPKTLFPKVGDGLVAAVRNAAVWAQGSGRSVFVVPGVVASSGKAKAEDVVESGVLLIDLDKGDIGAKRDHLQRHLGTASLLVASGGRTAAGADKLHLYWRLTEAARGADLKTLAMLRGTIAHAVGGDAAFESMHQPIRVAGTIHGKNGVWTLVRILTDAPLEYELSDLAERVLAMPVHAEAEADHAKRTDRKSRLRARDLMTRRIHAGGEDEESRFSGMSKVIGHWIRMIRMLHATHAEAWRALVEHNAAMIVPPWPEDRLRREFLALLRVDETANGPMPGERAGSADEGAAPADENAAPADEAAASTSDAGAPALSEDRLAADFVERHERDWRYVAAWGAWMRWSGSRWVRDETLAIREAVRRVCRDALDPGTRAPDSRRIASEKTIRAVERIAAADPVIAARVGDWDAHPLLLNTPGGMVHLETGEVSPHDPKRMLTQLTAASPAYHRPRWCEFLGEITGGDDALAAYLARLCGYCLTASTEEQVFAFLHGTGANGKSVFLQTVSAVMGDYAATAALATFTSARNEPHPTDLAGLMGKRLVTVSETEAGRAWAETRIKTITGGDPVRARFMHHDFFEFTPSFKLLVAGNHRPRLDGVGEAMRRRMHLVPFTVTIPPNRRDRRLGARLLEERDGVLGWMLDGYVDWTAKGLAPPPCVLQSAREYFDDEDLVGQWIAERCLQGPVLRASARDLFRSWGAWASDAGAEAGSQKSLGNALRERGFKSAKVGGRRGWIGLGLGRAADDEGAAAP